MVPVFCRCEACGRFGFCLGLQVGWFCQCCVEDAQSRQGEQERAKRRKGGVMAIDDLENICRIEFNRYRAAVLDADAALAFWLETGLARLDAARAILSAALDDVRRRKGE